MALGEKMMKEIEEIPRILEIIASNFERNEAVQSFIENQKFSSVILVARGTSDNAAHFLKYLIETKLGLPCGLASPSAATMHKVKFNYENVLVIALSQSGRSSDLLTFSKSAKDGGAYILSITNDEESTLARLSDLHIPILAGPELAVPATKSFIGQLFISYLLVASWAKENTHVEEIYGNARSNIEDQSYKQFADTLDISRPIYILGRGFSFPLAKEFALKLQETSLIPVQGMSSSDFLHGPIASINSESQVIFMAPHGLPEESFGQAPDQIGEITKKIYWIGSSPKPFLAEHLLSSPASSSEISAAITDVIHFQKITHFLATKNGLDPDSPKGLSKVTITL